MTELKRTPVVKYPSIRDNRLTSFYALRTTIITMLLRFYKLGEPLLNGARAVTHPLLPWHFVSTSLSRYGETSSSIENTLCPVYRTFTNFADRETASL